MRLLENGGYNTNAVPGMHRSEPECFEEQSICDDLSVTAIKQSIVGESDTFEVVFGSHAPVEEKAKRDFELDEKAHEPIQLVVKMASTTLFTMR